MSVKLVLNFEYSMEDFFSKLPQEPFKGALVRISSYLSGESIKHIVVSSFETEKILVTNGYIIAELYFFNRTIIGLDLLTDTKELAKSDETFIGREQFCDDNALKMHLSTKRSSVYLTAVTIALIRKNYFEYIRSICAPLKGYLPLSCIHLIQEYMS